MSSRGGQQPGQLHVVRQQSGCLSGVVPQRRVQAVVSLSVITWRPAARPAPRCPSAVRLSVRRGPAATRPGRGVTECHHVAASSPATSTLSVSCPAVCPAWSRIDASRPWSSSSFTTPTCSHAAAGQEEKGDELKMNQPVESTIYIICSL